MTSQQLENTSLLEGSAAAGGVAPNERNQSEEGRIQQVSCWKLLFLSLSLLLIGILFDALTYSDRRVSSIPLLLLSKRDVVSPADGTVLLQGFDSLANNNKSNDPYDLQWYCAPDTWNESEKGHGGAWELLSDSQLRLHPPAKKDFWRKTYYDPILIKDDGSVAYTTLDARQWYTITTNFTLTAVRQFDQAGIYLRLDADHWIKTGIEVVDHIPRLSVVVTNVYSDWSTQAWSDYSTEIKNDETVTVVDCQLKLHARGNNFVVEAKQTQESLWSFVRISHLSRNIVCVDDPIQVGQGEFQGPSPARGKMWAGVFAASPTDQQGCFVDFHDLRVVTGSSFEHSAD